MADLENSVQKGQRYQAVFNFLRQDIHFNIRTRPPVWEVQSVSTRFLSIPPIPHARLVNEKDPSDIRMVSCAAIADGRSFKLVGQPENQHVPEAAAA